MTQESDPTKEAEDRPPLGSWNRVYAVVLGSLVVVIVLLILFTRAFS